MMQSSRPDRRHTPIRAAQPVRIEPIAPRQSEAKPVLTTVLAAAMNGVGGGLGWSLVPPLMPEIAKDVGLSHAMGGLVWGAVPLGIALASLPGGAAADRLGPRRTAGWAMVAGALACAGRAFATGAWSLAAVMFLFGLHVGFVAPAIPKALAGHVPAARLARVNGLAVTAYTLATAATVLTARTVLLPITGGWRNAMLLAAAAMLATAVAWLVLLSDRLPMASHRSFWDVLHLARDRSVLSVGAMQWLLFGGYLALLGLLPRALREVGMSASFAGLAVAGWLVAAGLANAVGPWLSDKVGVRRPFLIGGALVAGSALLVMSALPPAAAPWLLVVAALGGGCFAPILLTLPLELPSVGPARAGAALGLIVLIGQLGGFILPVAAGVIAESHGFTAAVAALGVVHLLIVIPALGVAEKGAPAGAVVTGSEIAA